ncbi:MAG: hypothetical protein J6X49_05940 [Victivallales bacterium]|nr:hypothetical protein [Victivallales bacterium]
MKNVRYAVWLLAVYFMGMTSLWGFLPPTDAANGVKVSIDGVGEVVKLNEGVRFKVVTENGNANPIKVELAVWMNDDWKMEQEGNGVSFDVAANGRHELEFGCKALDRALEAWYPVHVKAKVTPSEGEAFELHPIALFRAEKPRMQLEHSAVVLGGEDQTAWLAAKGVTVDGVLNEWWEQATPISCGAERASAGTVSGDSFDGIVMFLHDKDNIYIAGQIADNEISCEDKTTDDFTNSDYLRLYFNGIEPSKRQDDAFTEADKIVAVSIFGGVDWTPEVKVPSYGKSNLPSGFKIMARRTGVGYVFELAMPKDVLGAANSNAIGMNMMIGDADGKVRRSEVYFGKHIDNYWLTPTAYFRLALGGVRTAKRLEDYQPETVVMGKTSIHLDRIASRRVAYKLDDDDDETVMERGFDGSDKESGMVLRNGHNINCRGDVRDALVFHPPFKHGVGYVKVTYRIKLPEKRETVFRFSTALREHREGESPSDGVEYIVEIHDGETLRRVFRKMSMTKTWEPTELDLRNYIGKTIDLSLIVTPGKDHNTSCDECYWNAPQICLKARQVAETMEQKVARRAWAIENANKALAGKTGYGRYLLKSADGTKYGAAIIPGKEGLADCFLAFSDGKQHLVYEGFTFDIAGVPYGLGRDEEPIVWKRHDMKYGRDIFYHVVETEKYGTVPLEVRVRPYGGTLQFTFLMPGVERDAQGQPRYTKVALGAGSEKPWRIYGGFGNVIEYPKKDFTLSRGGFTLNTRHVGVDYHNEMSLAIASDFFPDRMVCKPSQNLFTLEAHNDVTFYFAPSSKNAFMAAREYGRIVGFKPSPGLSELYGRQCLDQWGGDYQMAAEGAKMAAKYGLDHSIFVKHVWQRWGYDYRLPEIYPPQGGLEPFKQLADACQDNGIIFAPHDNYIDFYPDAEGYSYDHIIFNSNGTPQKAWYNQGRQAQSYRWLPHAFRPWMVKNMELIRDNIGAHGLFIDVFSAIPPMDYYDREGRFYDSKRTAKEWSAAFDTCREILWKDKAPMLSECGHDGLIGSLDGGQADHFSANRWGAEGEWERVPWHDIVSHGKFVLLGGGLGSRYAEKDPRPSGYNSDNYNGITVIGGRNPMSDGPFSTGAVKTYWMLHDVCDWLSRNKFDSFEFGETIHHLHSTFGGGAGQVWNNRSHYKWNLENGLALPEFGYYAETPGGKAGVVEKNGKTVAFAHSNGRHFFDARPPYAGIMSRKNITATVNSLKKVSEFVYEMEVEWNFEAASTAEKASQFIHVTHPSSKQGEGILYYGKVVKTNLNHRKVGIYHSTIEVTLPQDAPDGDFRLLFGIYNPSSGGRLDMTSKRMEGSRVFGGTIHVERKNGAFVTSIVETVTDDNHLPSLDLPMVDFDGVKTNGSFRWVRKDDYTWLMIPVPGSLPYRIEADVEVLMGVSNAKMVNVTNVEPWNETAGKPEVEFEDGVLKMAVDGRSFAYLVEVK